MSTTTAPRYARPFGDRDADNLYAAILDEPGADHLREILADRLEEIGDGDRAAFVRVQLELANAKPPVGIKNRPETMFGEKERTFHRRGIRSAWGKRQQRLRDRESALLARYGREWAAPVVALLPKCARCEGVGWFRSNAQGRPEPLRSDYIAHCDACHGSGLAASYSWDRGFVGRVTCTLAAFLGERCDHCGGHGRGMPWEHRPDERAFVLVGDCSVCHGSGYSGGLAAALPLVTPVTGWGLADREPYARNVGLTVACFDWYDIGRRDTELHPASELPTIIYSRLPEKEWSRHKEYPTADAACAALSAACRDLARSWCGLPAWAATGG